MAKSLGEMLPILRCPITKGELKIEGDWLVSGDHSYPVVAGRPILVRDVKPFHLAAPSAQVISQNIDSYYPPEWLPSDGVCLHLGSGNVPASDRRVISMDVLPNENVDIVAEAEALPFADGVIDFVVSGAVFEHLRDPIKSVKEARRVLKDRGRLVIDTAFMQGYHGFPSHYFNLTPQAVETILCDDFILEDSQVPKYAGPSNAIHTQVERYLGFLPPSLATALKTGSVTEFLAHLSDHDGCPDQYMTEYARRALAASFVVVARKPDGYDFLKKSDHSSITARAEFYSARMAVIHRHHEVSHFFELRASQLDYDVPELEPGWLKSTLARSLVNNPLDVEEFRAAANVLNGYAEGLVHTRDRVLGSLAEQSQAHEASLNLERQRRARKGPRWQVQRFRRWINRRVLMRASPKRPWI